MDIFLYVLTALIAYFGLLIGAALAHGARDEAHNLRHHLFFLQLVSFILLFVVFYAYFSFFIVTSMLILTFAFIWFFWHKQENNTLDYIAFSVLFAISSLVMQAHFYVTLIIFFFGIFSGAIYYVLHTHPEKKSKKKRSKSKSVSKPAGVAHHKHKGRHHEFSEIVAKLFRQYLFFLPLTIIVYALAQLLSLAI